MRRTAIIVILLGGLLAIAYLFTPTVEAPVDPSGDVLPELPPARIVSLAPSFTETLFALGEGDRVVGVTKFAAWPEAVNDLPQVGGFVDPNYEAIVGLAPDLVVASAYNTDAVDRLRQFGIPCLSMPHDNLAEIYAAIKQLGAVCGVPEKAAELVSELQGKLKTTRAATTDVPKQRVLLVVGREGEPGSLGQVYAAGTHGYLNTFLAAAGGTNVLAETGVNYPTLNAEGVLRLNPDVIIEIVGKDVDPAEALEEARTAWANVPEVSAVEKNAIHVLTGRVTTVPGPRMFVVLDGMVQALHPDYVPGAS